MAVTVVGVGTSGRRAGVSTVTAAVRHAADAAGAHAKYAEMTVDKMPDIPLIPGFRW